MNWPILTLVLLIVVQVMLIAWRLHYAWKHRNDGKIEYASWSDVFDEAQSEREYTEARRHGDA